MDGRPPEAVWPAFCLPYFRGEQPLVGTAAMQHRRSSDPEAWDDEARLDLNRRGRFLLAEGWLAMTLEPDSFQPSNAVCSWTPQGDAGERVELPFPDVIRSVLHQWSSPEVWLALIVPDGLGPGPRQEILDRIESDFDRVQLVPRSVAAALAWCSRQELRHVVNHANPTRGEHVAHLLVTTTPADTWEAALVPIRFEGESAQPPLCPVHQRVHHRSEVSYAGIEQFVPAGVRDGDTTAEKLWASWLEFDGHGHRLADPGRESGARTAFAAWSLPGRLRSGWRPGNATDEVNANLRQVLSESGIHSWVHVSSLYDSRVPDQFNFLRELDLPTPELVTEDTPLAGGLELLRLVAEEKTPYYESLAQVDLCVEGTNSYRDPVQEWKHLIEATEVPAGRDYTSPEPIMDLSLPPGEVAEIDLVVRSERRNRQELGSLRVVQERPQEEAVPVKVHARLSPGQGLVRFEVASVTPGSFLAEVRESQLTPRSGPPRTLYSWPPGSAWVAPDPFESSMAGAPLRDFLHALRTGRNIPNTLSRARDVIGTWHHQGGDREPPEDAPQGIHKLFVYHGVVPSDMHPVCESVAPLLEQICEAIPHALEASSDPQLQRSLFSFSSWLYARCPEHVLAEVRRALAEAHGALHMNYYACVGNCFTSSDDYRRFYRHLLHIQRGRNRDHLAKYPWIRAWRNLARFRVDSLRDTVITRQEMDRLLDAYLRCFSSAGHTMFLHCCYLAPHLLKRRRFDPNFLRVGGQRAQRFESVLKDALRLDPSRRQRANLECALEFLASKADVSTLKRLSDADDA
jgi:hypothetical protein